MSDLLQSLALIVVAVTILLQLQINRHLTKQVEAARSEARDAWYQATIVNHQRIEFLEHQNRDL